MAFFLTRKLTFKIVVTWEKLKPSDARLKANLTEKVVQNICKLAEFYVDKMFAVLAEEGFQGKLQLFIPKSTMTRVRLFCSFLASQIDYFPLPP